MREQSDRPLKYMSIATDLLARIDKGEWSSGRQLPSTMALAKEYGVALMTVRQALGILAQRGVVEPRQGAGTFVAGDRARDARSSRTLAVLITEDDEALCALTAAALRESGFDVDVAANGGQALLRLEAREDYDAIVLDLKLPDTDGFEIIDYIKANRPALRVIVASGYIDGEDVLRAAERWPLMMLRKPYSASDLVERLNALFGNSVATSRVTA
ncbi:MAG TPA: response regulator [Candidatus Eremiobacteraceae bacterium]